MLEPFKLLVCHDHPFLQTKGPRRSSSRASLASWASILDVASSPKVINSCLTLFTISDDLNSSGILKSTLNAARPTLAALQQLAVTFSWTTKGPPLHVKFPSPSLGALAQIGLLARPTLAGRGIYERGVFLTTILYLVPGREGSTMGSPIKLGATTSSSPKTGSVEGSGAQGPREVALDSSKVHPDDSPKGAVLNGP
ncbi:hypothetical protein B296_00020938 [Ensete ventricosum]|uniref:Uncharacterized protein n=1 Tax=Ensete ventricosum TaxID=4639 RepID=A0A426YJ80_ENSVE|nr:hypothetical protein B296_00020938 [Ensete ventricosum]